MSKRIYISADYSEADRNCNVFDELHKWGNDNLHRVDYCDTALVAKGGVSNNQDCRPSNSWTSCLDLDKSVLKTIVITSYDV